MRSPVVTDDYLGYRKGVYVWFERDVHARFQSQRQHISSLVMKLNSKGWQIRERSQSSLVLGASALRILCRAQRCRMPARNFSLSACICRTSASFPVSS